jgi:hypothetical protein
MMMGTDARATGPRARRVLVALDTVSRQPELLEPAVALATLLGAELDALFVEDETLLRAAGLRSSREIVLVSATERRISAADMARALRRLAATLQAQIDTMAARAGIIHRFEIVRGVCHRAVHEARASCDVIVTGHLDVAWPPHTPIRVLRLLLAANGAAAHALDVTVGLAGCYRADVELVVPQTQEAELGETIVTLGERLRGQGLDLHLRRCRSADCLATLAADPLAGRLVILPADLQGIGSAEALRDWINALKCPLVLVR